jgi:hypothetical protein
VTGVESLLPAATPKAPKRPQENLHRLAAPAHLRGRFLAGAFREDTTFKDLKKGDWAFVAACLVASIFCVASGASSSG